MPEITRYWWVRTLTREDDDHVLAETLVPTPWDPSPWSHYEPGRPNPSASKRIQDQAKFVRRRWKYGDGKKRRPAFIFTIPCMLRCRKETFEQLNDRLDLHSELFPIEIGDDFYTDFGPSKVFDIFDSANSAFRTLPSGTRTDFRSIVFRHAPKDAPDLFRIDGERTIRFNIFATDHFKETVDALGCDGLTFKEVQISGCI